MIRSALTFDANATRILQMVGGFQKFNHQGRLWNVNMDMINQLSDFDPADHDSFLSRCTMTHSIIQYSLNYKRLLK
eukprot:SAG31_NODE_16372_length_711_cov_2.602941_1_plen_76_part_00